MKLAMPAHHSRKFERCFCTCQRPNRLFFTKKIHKCTYQVREKDSETGKEAFQLRLWDGRIGKWLSPDPAGKGDSPYTGMYNNPLKYVDVAGRDTLIFHQSKRLNVLGRFDVHMLTFSIEVNGKRKALNHNYLMVANNLSQQKKGNDLRGYSHLHPITNKEILDIRFEKMSSHTFINSIYLAPGGRNKYGHAGNVAGDWDGCWGICRVEDLIKRDNFTMSIALDKSDTYEIADGNRARFQEIRNIYERVKKLYNLNGQHILLELNSNAVRSPLNHSLKPKGIKSPRFF